MPKYNLTLENIRKGIRHPKRVIDEVVLEYAYRLPLTLLNSKIKIGTNVFDREWDILVILDTCRVDALQAIANTYTFIDEVDSIRSVGGGSGEWIARTFDHGHKDQIRETIYLTANGHAKQILDDKTPKTNPDKHLTYKALRYYPTVGINEFKHVEYLFQYEPWGEQGPLGHKKGMTPPRYVTDRAITIGREMEFDRMILHYFQPHSPWVWNAIQENRDLNEYEEDWWNYFTESGDFETIWNAYLDDLHYVLRDVEVLLENINADEVVISADHGEAFGEYGILGHKLGSLHPKIRTVPWVSTEARDTKTYEPSITPPDEDNQLSSSEVQEQLEALGYR